jgi:hypothetical protein
MKLNKLINVNKVMIKTAFIDSKNNLVGLTKNMVHLNQENILSIEEQKHIITVLKKNKLPKKCVCSAILENQVAFMTDGFPRHFDFDEIELTYDDLVSLENDNCAHLNTFEHSTLKPIIFKSTPLGLSDLNEIFIVLREVTKIQIKTRKHRILNKDNSNTKLSKSGTRKQLHK